MRMLSGLLVFGGTCLLPGTLQAQANGLTLEDCVGLALERNPLMLAADGYVDASRARARQAWSLPQPSLGIDSDLQPGLTRFRDHGERYVGISQTIPFPLRTWVEAQAARRGSGEVATEREQLALDLTYQTTEAFYGLLLAEERSRLAELNLELAREFLALTKSKLMAGDVPRVEMVRAGVEVATAGNEARRAAVEVRLARARLNVLLGRQPTSPLELRGELRGAVLAPDLQALRDAAFESRPELRRNTLSTERESYQQKAGYLSWLPDFDVGAARHTIAGEPDTWDVTLSLSLPLFFWQPVTGEIAEARANLRALREERTHLVNSIHLEVDEAYSLLATAAEQILAFEQEILPQAEDAYRTYLFSYERGQISALDLIESRRTLNDARTSYADALYEHDLAMAGLERSVGCPLTEPYDDEDALEPAVDPDRVVLPDAGGMRHRVRLQRRFRGGRTGG